MPESQIIYNQFKSTGSANGQFLMSNGTSVVWGSNVNNIILGGTFAANGSVGVNGQVLTSNSTGGAYWAETNEAATDLYVPVMLLGGM